MKNFDPTISLGLDYSYEEPGFCVSQKIGDKEVILHVSRMNFAELQRKGKEKDKHFKIDVKKKRQMITDWIRALWKKYRFTVVIVERIRTFSHGHLSVPAIIAFAELILTVVNATINIDQDVAYVPVFSVDTRVWRKRMVGSAQAPKGTDPKAATLAWAKQFITSLLLEKRRWLQITHNEADAIGLSLFARHVEAEQFLKEEE